VVGVGSPTVTPMDDRRRGILHIEAPPAGIGGERRLVPRYSAVVNLPRANKWNPPRYQDIRGSEATLLTTMDGGALLRLIAGELGGHRGPGSTFTPIHRGSCHCQPWVPVFACPAARLQRPGLCAGGKGQRGRRAPADPRGPARCLRAWRSGNSDRRHDPGCRFELRGAAARGPADR